MREMKNSGIEWIGDIPSNWKRTKLLNLLRSHICDGPHETPILVDEGIPFISVDSLNSTKNIDFGKCKKFISEEDYLRYKEKANLEEGDILFTKAATIGKTAIVGADIFMVWSPIAIIKANAKITINEYIYHLLSCSHLIKYISLLGSYNTQINVGMRELEQASVPLPPLFEQHKIADYLDCKCAEIDAVIEKTKATIEEYKKLKQSVITEAVTKGIRGDRPMKDSGIEWIIEIAEDWRISRVGLHYNIILGKMLCDKQLKDDYTLEEYLCAANVHFDGVEITDLKKMWFSPIEKETYAVKIGDLVVVEGGAGAGGSSIVYQLNNPTYVQNSVMIVRNKINSDNRYLRYWVECLVKKGYISVVCNKATIPHFTKDKLASMPVPVLSTTEQIEIADYLDKKCAEIDTLIAKKTTLLEEMENYKKSVIYEYVTGKKEVKL